MSLEKTRDPNVLKSVNGGGCLMLFGSPFFLAGLFIMAGGLGLFKVEGDGPQWALVPFGLIFASVGAGLMFGRKGIIIDRRLQTATEWWGLMVPFKRTTRPINDYTAVTIRKEIRRNKNSATTIYPVRIESDRTAASPLDVSSLTDFQKARAEAEQVAKLLNFNLSDHTGGKPKVREAAALDESIRERARKTGERIELPDPPPGGLRSKIGHRLGGLIIEIPPPSPGIFDIIRVIPALIFAGFVFFTFFLPMTGDTDMDPSARALLLSFLGFFFMAVPLLVTLAPAIKKLYRRETVIVNRDRLRHETKGLIKTMVVEIPNDKLEELNLAAPPNLAESMTERSGQWEKEEEYGVSTQSRAASMMPGGEGTVKLLTLLNRFGKFGHIQARSDQAAVTFGQGLSPEELKYLHALIKKTVSE